MPPRLRTPVALLVCLTCPGFLQAQSGRAAAEQLWKQGQDALERGELATAERHYTQSLAIDPTLVRCYLSLASIHLGRDDLEGAARHLAGYLNLQPDQRLIRMRFADLLLRTRRVEEARAQYHRCIADTQTQAGASGSHLIHCHRRLMEIAEVQKDYYHEHLHRGVGLYLLARERATAPVGKQTLPVEGILFKAVAELHLAQVARSTEARPCWYLHEAWVSLGQRQQAQRWLRAAVGAEQASDLTPAESGKLHLAWLHLHWEALSRHGNMAR